MGFGIIDLENPFALYFSTLYDYLTCVSGSFTNESSKFKSSSLVMGFG
jgi:hypothetical protein